MAIDHVHKKMESYEHPGHEHIDAYTLKMRSIAYSKMNTGGTGGGVKIFNSLSVIVTRRLWLEMESVASMQRRR